jgi:type IV pilus assembly protein PilW
MNTTTPSRASFVGSRLASGFTLVELMVAMAIGLITSLAIAQVLMFSEGYKRTATAGSDAQTNGSLALYTLQRDIQMAGYGFASDVDALGCAIYAKFNGADVATGAGVPTFPAVLAPVLIDTTDPNRNTVRVLSSSKTSYSIPTRIIAPSYNPALPATANRFMVNSTLGTVAGDLMLATGLPGAICEVFAVSNDPTVTSTIDRIDDTKWNATGFPTATYNDGNALVNLGTLEDSTYSINAAGSLQQVRFALNALTGAPGYAAARDLFPNVVALRAYYGLDTNNDQIVDTYTQTQPTTNTGWLQVRTVRLALVSRSTTYERDVVTGANPQWDVGNTSTFAPAATPCGTSRCLTLGIDTLPDWQHYRYKVFDTEVPLRNMLWSS